MAETRNQIHITEAAVKDVAAAMEPRFVDLLSRTQSMEDRLTVQLTEQNSKIDKSIADMIEDIRWHIKLQALQETDGIESYHEQFELIRTRVTLPEDYLVSAYLAGLCTDTQMNVRMFQPHTVRQCFLIGKLYESVHPRARSDATGASEFKNSTSNQPNPKILYSSSNGFSSANSTRFSVPIDLERKRRTPIESTISLLTAIANIQPTATTAVMTSDHSLVVPMDQARSIPVSLSDPSRSRHAVQQFKKELSPSNTKDKQFCLSQEATKTQGLY